MNSTPGNYSVMHPTDSLNDPLCPSRYLHDGVVWRCRMRASSPGDHGAVSHICDGPLQADGSDNTLVWSNADQLPTDIAEIINTATLAEAPMDWRLYIDQDDLPGLPAAHRQIVELTGTAHDPISNLEAVALTVFPAAEHYAHFIDDGYSLAFGEVKRRKGGAVLVQLCAPSDADDVAADDEGDQDAGIVVDQSVVEQAEAIIEDAPVTTPRDTVVRELVGAA